MGMRHPFIYNFIQWVFFGIVFVSSICGSGCPVQAAETDITLLESRVISSSSLNDFLSYTFQVNPSIKAGRAAWKAAIETYRVETGYPDPQVSTTYWSPDPSRDYRRG